MPNSPLKIPPFKTHETAGSYPTAYPCEYQEP